MEWGERSEKRIRELMGKEGKEKQGKEVDYKEGEGEGDDRVGER